MGNRGWIFKTEDASNEMSNLLFSLSLLSADGDPEEEAVPGGSEPLQQEARAGRPLPDPAGLPGGGPAGHRQVPAHEEGSQQADDRGVPREPAELLQHGRPRVRLLTPPLLRFLPFLLYTQVHG